MDQKLSALLKMGQLQTAVSALFFQAETAKATGDYETARPIYEDYVAKSLALLQASLKFNRKFPESPWDIRPIAQPLQDICQINGHPGHRKLIVFGGKQVPGAH